MCKGEEWIWRNEAGELYAIILGLVSQKQVQIRFTDEKGRTQATKWVSPSSLSRLPGEAAAGPDEVVPSLAVGAEEGAGDQLPFGPELLAAETDLGAGKRPEDLIGHLTIGQ